MGWNVIATQRTPEKEKDFAQVIEYLNRLKSYNLKNPFLVGFGINDKQTFETVSPHANGAIIGSAFIKSLSGSEDAGVTASNFVKSVLN